MAVRPKLDASGRLEQIGPYRVVEKLGRGGMGVVYRVVRDGASPDTSFALKTIESRFLSRDDSNAKRRFLREIDVMKKLDHPAVVRFRDAGVAEDSYGAEILFLVTDFLDGESLQHRIKSRGPISPSTAIGFAADIANALAYLERMGLAHRDLTPNNVFIVRSPERAVLIDFGLARSEDFTRLTESGAVIGSLRYMAPERLQHGGGDIRADIFGLGAATFEMLSGQPAFQVTDNRLSELIHSIRQGLPWTPELRLSAGEPLSNLLDATVDFEPDLRPQPPALAERLAALRTAPTATVALAPAAPEKHPSEAPEAEREVPPPEALKPGRQIQGWVLLATIILFAGGLAGGWIGSQAANPAPSISAVPLRSDPASPALPPPPQVFRTEAEPAAPKPDAFPQLSSDASAFAFGRYADLEGNAEWARRAYERAIELNPVMAEAHRDLGELLRKQDDVAAALRHIRIYIALRPNAPDSQRLRTWADSIERATTSKNGKREARGS